MLCSQHDETTQMGIDNINALLDSFMGINDSELAEQVNDFANKSKSISLLSILQSEIKKKKKHINWNVALVRWFNLWFLTLFFSLHFQIWDLANNKTNSMDFAEAIDNSDLEAFEFTDDFIIELWGAITDARRRITKKS